jgi:hypothetical protein
VQQGQHKTAKLDGKSPDAVNDEDTKVMQALGLLLSERMTKEVLQKVVALARMGLGDWIEAHFQRTCC